MSKEEAKPKIIVRRVKKGGHGGHHGGAWKIAYADFVTAMMAFFLLMWLLGSTSKGDLNGIADYFQNPLKVSMSGGSGSGDSSSVIQGGGTNLSRTNGQEARSTEPSRQTVSMNAMRSEIAREETARMHDLKQRVERALEANLKLGAFRSQIRIDVTSEGLRIQIVDEQNRPMFDSGRAALKDHTREILREIARVLNTVDNKVALSGHTDSQPYTGGERGYSNWELSADRANASRRELVAGGLADNKIVRVVGLADSLPMDAANPLSAANRRISIIVMNKLALAAARGEGPTVEVGSAAEAASVPSASPAAPAAPPAR